MATDLIRYDLLVQEALRGVVRHVLDRTMREGLPGEHHYYVTFRTGAPGVRLSQRMRERYPEEMTIILQHQFWDLSVNEHGFEVGLSFSGNPERLAIPFEALTGFFDPSVQFGLKFEVQEATNEVGANDAGAPPPLTGPKPARTSASAPAKSTLALAAESKPAPRGAGSEPAEVRPAEREAKPPRTPKESEGGKKGKLAEGEQKVISIDAFRKKP